MKGVKLQGVITWFDNFSLLLRREGASQLVYKHAISTIMPAEPPPDFWSTTTSEGAQGRSFRTCSSPQRHASMSG